MTELAVVSMLVQLLVTAFALRALAATIPDFEIDGWASAIGAALVIWVLGISISFVLSMTPLSAILHGGPWIAIAFGVARSALTVAIALAIAPAVNARMGSALVAGVCLYAVNYGVSILLGLAQKAAA